MNTTVEIPELAQQLLQQLKRAVIAGDRNRQIEIQRQYFERYNGHQNLIQLYLQKATEYTRLDEKFGRLLSHLVDAYLARNLGLIVGIRREHEALAEQHSVVEEAAIRLREVERKYWSPGSINQIHLAIGNPININISGQTRSLKISNISRQDGEVTIELIE